MKARRRNNSGYTKSESANNNEENQTNANRGSQTHPQDDSSPYCQHQVSTDSIDEEVEPSDNPKLQDQSGLWIPNFPSVDFYFLIATFSLYFYFNTITGEMLHDDIYAIKNNKDILPETPVSEVFVHDYWGRPLTDPRSHKSYRPLTTLTFR